jgi:hypothetical protein
VVAKAVKRLWQRRKRSYGWIINSFDQPLTAIMIFPLEELAFDPKSDSRRVTFSFKKRLSRERR